MTPQFTSRQMQVVQGVACGKLDKEIAADLNIATRTVKRHLEDIYGKMDFHGMGSRYRLIAWSFRNKLAA